MVLNFMATGIYSYTRSFAILAPAPDRLLKPQFAADTDRRIPADVAQRLGIAATGPVTLLYRTVEEEGTGPRKGVVNGHYYQLQGGINTALGDTMDFDAYVNIAGSNYFSTVVGGYTIKRN